MHGELELDADQAPGARFVLRMLTVVRADGTGRLTVKSR
jgi:hypothetical protein